LQTFTEGKKIMNRKILGIFACMLVITTSLPAVEAIQRNLNLSTYDPLDGGWFEECDGIEILYVSGSSYDMGYQHGFLLKNETHANFRTFCHWIIDKEFSYDELVEKWNIMKPYLPQCYIDEMQGMADGSGLSLENISVLNVGFYLMVNCGSFAAWGPATVDERLYNARSHDFPITLKDPDTGTYLVETQVLIVRKPVGYFSSVSPSEAGFVSVSDGFNEKGIASGMLSSWTNDEKLQGIGVGFRMRMVLDFAFTIEEAINIITSNKTLGYNFIASDGKTPVGYAIETTANLSYAGTWDNPSESTHPFWSIDSVVRRANIFVDPATATTQRKRYYPGIFPMLSLLLNTNQMSGTSISAAGPWLHYIALSKGIESQWGKLDLNKTIAVLRNVYLGRTDIRFFILQKLGSYTTPYQWVMCPETGDFVVSFATRDKNAFENPVHFFNLFDLLETEPP